MKTIRYLLFPVVPIYYVVTWLRNKLYDWGIKKSKSYPFPVICVGNLSTGGTGKTPMVEYLVNLLKDEFNLATLSRGYKRKTNGFQLADKHTTAEILGDEPFQFYNKFNEDIIVAVDADRQNGITQLLNLNNAPEVVLLDDAFQHRKVKAGFNILLTTYSQPYFKDMVLPTGNLREPKSGAKRADIIVVTKCPEYIGETEKNIYKKQIAPLPHQQVFFSAISYSERVISQRETLKLDGLEHFTLVTGIANAMPLVDFLKGKNLNFEHLNFKDHHNFSEQDIEMLTEKQRIITTEKDFVRLQKHDVLKGKLFYLPIRATIDDQQKFNKLITDFVKR